MVKWTTIAILLGCLALWATEAPARAEGPGGDYLSGGDGPRQVWFYIFVVDIDDIDGAAQNFAVNVFLRLRWRDESLADEKKPERRLPLHEVWNPRVLIANRQAFLRTSLPNVVEVAPDGMVTYRQRYVGPLSQPLRLSEFPFDHHDFRINFVAVGYDMDEVEFLPDTVMNGELHTGGAIAEQLSLPDWEIEIEEYPAKPRAYQPTGGEGTPGFAFEFVAERSSLYYIWQVIVPLVLIVMMSWASFYIDPTNAGAQIAVATSSMLTLIAYRFTLGNLIPRLPYMTRLDYFTLASTILVFLTLVEVLATSILARRGRARPARTIDRISRAVFPLAFATLVVWSLIL